MKIYFTEKAVDLFAGTISVLIFGVFLGILLFIFEHDQTTIGQNLLGGITLSFIIRICMFFSDNKPKEKAETRFKTK